MRKLLTILFALLLSLQYANAEQALLAFPGADGYGKYVTGGRGGEVYYVTRLDDCTDTNLVPGTLRWALRHDNGGKPRTILFNVSGTIYLTSKLKLQYPDVSILGQTAPGGGITIAGFNMYICKNNVIVRYVRFRAGDIPNSSMTGLDMENCSNIILDHCSMTWSMEECLTAYDTKYTTIQWCIIGEGLYSSKNAKGSRAYAMQWGGEHSTMHHTLITNSHSRSPRFNGVRSYSNNRGDHDYEVDSEFANNVIFNWSGTGAIYGGEYDPSKVEKAGTWTDEIKGYNRVYMMNNYYKPGPSTKKNNTQAMFASPSSPYGQWYANGNKFEETGTYCSWTQAAAQAANNNNMNALNGLSATYKMSEIPYALSGMTYESADNAYNAVVTKAGASLPRYDEVDQRLLDEAAGKRTPQYTGSLGELGIIDAPDNIKLSNAGVYYANGMAYNNYPSMALKAGDKYAKDSDGDGLPDAYEDEKGLNKNDATDGAAVTANGYTNLENYLNAIADGTINKATYETLDNPDVAGSMRMLPAVDGTKKYEGYFVNGQFYEAGKEYFIANDAVLQPVVKVVFDYYDMEDCYVTTSTKLTMPMAAKQDYNFLGWTDGNNLYEGGKQYNITSSVTLMPKFSKQSGPVERVLYSTDFSNWTAVASSTSVNTKTVTTDVTNESLTFSWKETQVAPAGTNTKFSSPATTGYMMAAKTATPYIETSALGNISSITFVHCATGGSRGWGVQAKGDGDSDWVTISNSVANPAGGCEKTVDVNKKNVKLRFYNLTSDQNAYLTSLVIRGMVQPQGDLIDVDIVPSPYKGGTVAVTPDAGSFEKNTEVTAVATPNDGYLFMGWEDKDGNVLSSNTSYTFTVTEEKMVKAIFKSVSDFEYITENCAPYDAAVKNVAELTVALQKAAARADKNKRYRIFLFNGTYDFGSKAKTAVVQNTSLIGESQEGVLVMNTAVLKSSYQEDTPVLFIDQNQNNVYMQDITVRQARDWDAKKSNGQCIAIRQRGKFAAYKNVTIQGVQDTYYINKADASAYFEDCTLAGEVDFIYGDGTLFFQNCNLNPISSGAVITASNAQTGYVGMVFNDCTIDGASGYALGRPWNDSPAVTYINTTMKQLPQAAGWKGMTANLVCRFHEYGSKDADGNALDLSSRSISACSAAAGSDACVINAEQAKDYTLEKTFAKWPEFTPAAMTKQTVASEAKMSGNVIAWTAASDAIGYAICKDNAVVGFSTTNSFTVDESLISEGAEWTVRAANAMGGLGNAIIVDTSTDVNTVYISAPRPYAINGKYVKNGKIIIIKDNKQYNIMGIQQ
ncbi:MAG: hypothetical protein KBT34_06560 [Prevotella sp.]|nr:hypothetical protein [Candidatus Prevotella equi]